MVGGRRRRSGTGWGSVLNAQRGSAVTGIVFPLAAQTGFFPAISPKSESADSRARMRTRFPSAVTVSSRRLLGGAGPQWPFVRATYAIRLPFGAQASATTTSPLRESRRLPLPFLPLLTPLH